MESKPFALCDHCKTLVPWHGTSVDNGVFAQHNAKDGSTCLGSGDPIPNYNKRAEDDWNRDPPGGEG